MRKTIIAYQSEYGFTTQYAQWTEEELGCCAKELKAIKKEEWAGYDTVIFGGSIYAGSVSGAKKFSGLTELLQGKKLAIFLVGFSDPENRAYYMELAQRNFPPELSSQAEFFFFRGGLRYSKMGLSHKMMMWMMRKVLSKTPPERLSREDRMLLEHYGTDTDDSDRQAVRPLTQWARGTAFSGK